MWFRRTSNQTWLRKLALLAAPRGSRLKRFLALVSAPPVLLIALGDGDEEEASLRLDHAPTSLATDALVSISR